MPYPALVPVVVQACAVRSSAIWAPVKVFSDPHHQRVAVGASPGREALTTWIRIPGFLYPVGVPHSPYRRKPEWNDNSSVTPTPAALGALYLLQKDALHISVLLPSRGYEMPNPRGYRAGFLEYLRVIG